MRGSGVQVTQAAPFLFKDLDGFMTFGTLLVRSALAQFRHFSPRWIGHKHQLARSSLESQFHRFSVNHYATANPPLILKREVKSRNVC